VSANEESLIPPTKPELTTFGRDRLAPGSYHIDLSALVDFPLKENGQTTTFADLYNKLRDAKILEMPVWIRGDATFDTDAGKVTVSGESGSLFVISALRDLIDLLKDGIDPYRATWFYFGHDWSIDADELYQFFLVYDGKLVRESVSIVHGYPRLLKQYKVDDQPIWHSEPYERQAWETYWYRKFYTETITGQLMVLRSDEPTLYNYARAERDVTRDVGVVTLIKLYGLLRVAVPLLGAIAFPMLWPYMAFLAAALTVDLLWRAWATRKIGS
jgi:hypothetical protein